MYVRHFPDNGSKVRVSSAGGRIPRWSPNTKELLYETDVHRLMAVTYTLRDGVFVASTPTDRSNRRLGDTGVLANFDISGDGRIVALMPAMSAGDDELPNHATFILNFLELVRRRTSAK